MKAPLVVVTVVVACARASAQQAQIPAASRAAPIFLMFVFILRIRVGVRAWSSLGMEREPRIGAPRTLSQRPNRAPLWPNARIGEAAQQVG